MNIPKLSPVGLVIASMSSVQVGAAISVPLFATLGVAGTTWLRIAIAALALLLVVRPRGLDRRQLGAAAALGTVMAANMMLFASATHRIPLGVAVAVEFCGPLGVAAFSRRGAGPAGSRWVLDLARRSRWPLVALAGVLLLAQPWQLDRVGGGSAWLGLAGAAGAGAGWAVYIVLMAHVGRLVPGLQGLAVALPVAAVILAPFGAPPVLAAAGAGDWWVLGRCALAAALVPLGAYALEVAALRQMPEPVFGVWMSLEPAFGALAGLALLAQPVAAAQLPGFALVVLAGVATQRAADRRARGELTPSPILQGANR